MTKSIMIAGVGGQGTLLTSRILGRALIDQGFDVKVSEVHGMSQRGGSVVTYVRCGDSVASPLIEPGGADIVLAFEALEALRMLPYLKNDGVVLTARTRIDPMPVITGAAAYPEDPVGQLRKSARVIDLDALSLARRAGSVRCANVVLIGLLARHGGLPIPEEAWRAAIRAVVPEKYIDLNLRAFELGLRPDANV